MDGVDRLRMYEFRDMCPDRARCAVGRDLHPVALLDAEPSRLPLVDPEGIFRKELEKQGLLMVCPWALTAERPKTRRK